MKKRSKWQPLKLSGSKGLTLIEMIVAVALASFVLFSLYGVYITSYKSYQKTVTKAEINQNSRIALERITRDLRQTERIVTTLPPDDTDALNPPSQTLKFQDGHNTDKIQYIEYSLENGVLKRKTIHYYFTTDQDNWVAWNAQDENDNLAQESIDEDVVKADKVSVLQFYGDKLITIKITTASGDQTQSYMTKVLGRNIQ